MRLTQHQDTRQISARVEELLSQMTLEEKIAQLCCCTLPDTLDDETMERLFSHGMGTVNYLNSALTGDSQKDVDTLQRIQEYLHRHTRLGIPVLAHSEAIAGAQIPGATTFPQSLGMAATWQPELAEQMGEAVRAQLRSYGIYAAHSPLFDLGRDPRWGRIGETYGESPMLVAQMGTRFVRGLQGNDELMATAKHFIAYGNSCGGRNGGQVDLSERSLLEEYCFPFEAAIREGNVMAVMNSYGTLNGEPTVTSRYLMTELLREKLGFDGPVVSDYGSVERSFNRFGTAASRTDAAVQALTAGIDVDQPDGVCFHQLVDAVRDGLVEEACIDQAAHRVLSVKCRLGLLDDCAPQGSFEMLTADPAVHALSRSIAEKSIVLAKNDGVLPLRENLTVAVIGPSADTVLPFFGGYSSVGTVNASNLDFNRSELDNFRTMMLEIYTTQRKDKLLERGIIFDVPPTPEQEAQILELVKEDLGKRSERKVYKGQEDFLQRYYPKAKTVRQALSALLGEEHVLYAPGCGVKLPLEGGIEDALSAAEKADVVIAVVGGQESMRSVDATCGENKDNTNLDLEAPQRELMKALSTTGKPIVIVLIDGRPLAIRDADRYSDAVLYAWLPGEHGGEAIADILTGKAVPGGKMPITVLRHAGQIPMRYDLQPLFEGPTHMAEYLDSESSTPLYPFGHGLSYTSFQYSDLSVSPQVVCGETMELSFKIRNTGSRPGEEVAQIYMRDLLASVVRPMRQLAAFARVALEPGEEKLVHIWIDTPQLAFYGRDMQLGIEPGKRQVMVGSSCEDIRLRGETELTGERLLLKQRRSFPKVEII